MKMHLTFYFSIFDLWLIYTCKVIICLVGAFTHNVYRITISPIKLTKLHPQGWTNYTFTYRIGSHLFTYIN